MEDISTRDDEKAREIALESGREEERRRLAEIERAKEEARKDAIEQEKARQKEKNRSGSGLKYIVYILVLAIILAVVAWFSLTVTVTFARSPSGELAQPAAGYRPASTPWASGAHGMRARL